VRGKQEEAELERWRRIYREHLQEEGSPDCPAPEILAAAVTGEIDEAERQRVAAHVVSCRRCSAAFRTLLALHQEAEAARRPHRLRPWLLPLAASLGALVCGLVLFQVFVGSRPDDRGPASPLRTVTAPRTPSTTPAPDAHLAAPPAEISWPAEDSADGYRLELHDAAGVLLWASAPLPTSRVALPAAVRQRLTPGESYFWVVQVSGRVPKRLGPFWFDLAQRGTGR
jgi:hypothetical protein